jgi:hypothetical protein
MYTLDPQSARKADSQGAMITELGKYIGTITQAVEITASTGTTGLDLTFESQGQKARLSLYTRRENGEPLMGLELVMAIMTVLGLREIKPTKGTYQKYDFDAKAMVERQGTIFPALCGKPIGILLETEEYAAKDGSTKTRMILKGVFQANTELVASEILDRKTEPKILERLVMGLRHRQLKVAKFKLAMGTTNRETPFQDDDLDIPF